MPHPSVHVVIAGGGVAGLETVLALRDLAGRRVRMTLVTMASQTIERPITVAEPFDRAIAPTRHLDAIAADLGVELVHERLAAVRPHENVAVLSGGRSGLRPARRRHRGGGGRGGPRRLTFRGAAGRRRPPRRARRAALRRGALGRVRVASESVWPVPLYELALMMGADLRGHGSRTLPSRSSRRSGAAGPVRPARRRGPRAAAGRPRRARAHRRAAGRRRAGRLVLADGGDVDADRVVALPVPHGKP